MNIVSLTLQRYSKFIAALIGIASEAVNLSYVPHSVQNGISIAISILTAIGVAGVSNGPAMADGVAIANDVASLKEQIGPLKNLKGWQNAVAWLHGHGKEVMAIVEAAKTDVEDLLGKKPVVSPTVAAPVTFDPPAPAVAQPPAGNTPTIPADAVSALSNLVGGPSGT